ncbi:MAG: hypothetical protein V1915_00505 [Candidatus Bathyarchaeota archaeon]
MRALIEKYQIAIVPGAPFLDKSGENTIWLKFSRPSLGAIPSATQTISKLFQEGYGYQF